MFRFLGFVANAGEKEQVVAFSLLHGVALTNL